MTDKNKNETSNDMLITEFSSMLVNYSKELHKLSALKVKTHLQKWWDSKAHKEESVPSMVRYDVTAFMFSYADDDNDGPYFREIMSYRTDKGEEVKIPDINSVTEDELNHWAARSAEVTHPVMKMRYADLVWELTEMISGKKADVNFARRAIDAYLQTVEKELYDEPLYAIHYCERALHLALSVSDKTLIERCKKCFFSLYDIIADYSKIGLWVFLFDDLLEKNADILTEDEILRIISALEEIHKWATSPTDGRRPDPFVADAASDRLARYYKKEGCSDKAKQFIKEAGLCFEHLSVQANSLLAISWLENVLNKYDQYGMIEDKNRVLSEMKKRGMAVKDEMKQISGEIKIPADEINKLIENVCSAQPEEALSKLIFNFMPNLEHAENMKKHLKDNCVLLSMLSTSVIHNGNIEARVGSIDEDDVGHSIQWIAQHISINSGFISLLLEEMKKRKTININDVVDFIGKSALIGADEAKIIQAGILAHLNDNFVSSIHILAPQCEKTIRSLSMQIGAITTKYNRRDRTVQEKTLYELLIDEAFNQVVPKDLRLYLQCLLVDKRGLNVRNNVAHGLLALEAFTGQLSAQLIYCLLLLSILRVDKAPDKTSR